MSGMIHYSDLISIADKFEISVNDYELLLHYTREIEYLKSVKRNSKKK